MAAHWVLFLLGCCCVAWPAAACVMAEEQQLALFKTWDIDHDGKLTEAEYVTGEHTRLPAANHSMTEEAVRARYRGQLRPGSAAISPDDFAPMALTRC